ncbi:MAG: Hsp20/alpha crystallin family protein, partial [Candidatus Mucispirillum faecigallinarum]|nr:Hsp20/alpha crystallin family protein [Candidatus Mucispirillum faecigallinarum]
MSIMKWDPLKDLFFMEKHIDKLINNSFKEKSYDWLPVVDVVENDNVIILYAELPGVSENDMEVNISDGILSISGNKKVLS